VQSLEVSKTATPDQDANALGGNIEVKSLSGFDREGTTYSLSGVVAYDELMSETNPKVSGTFTSVLNSEETLAVAAALSYEDRDFGSHNIETDGGWETPDQDDFPGAPDYNMPAELEQRIYEVNRKRTGVAVNLDYRPSDEAEYYIRSLYSDFEDHELRHRAEFKIEDASSIDSLTATSGTVSDGLEMDRDLKNRLETQTITSVILGGDFTRKWGEFDVSLGYSTAEEAEPGRVDADFEGDLSDATYASWDGIQSPVVTAGSDAYDAALFELDKVEFTDGKAQDEAVQFAANLSYNFEFNGNPSTVKIGTKLQMRDKEYVVDFEVWEDFSDSPVMADFNHFVPEFELGQAGPTPSATAIASYLASLASGDYEVDPMDSAEGTWAPRYDIAEDSSALYAMQTIDFGDARLIYGVRYQNFSTDLNGYEVSRDDDNDVINIDATHYDRSEDFWLPSIHIRHRLNDAWQARASISSSAVRPTFEQMSPGKLIVREDFNGIDFDTNEAELGNPNLDTMTSTNFDATIEYYAKESLRSFSAGLFYKDIKDFVYQADIAGTSMYVDFDEAISFANGAAAELYGIEANAVQRFDNGFIVSANATLTNSEADYAGVRASTSLPGQSDTTANLVVGWEGEWLSARLASTYKSGYIRELDLDDPSSDQYQDSHSSLDASIRAVVGAIEVKLDATNLTDEPYFAYTGNGYNTQYDTYGRTIRLGLTLRNF